VLTNGGRVLCVTSLGRNIDEARERSYRAFDRISWSGKIARRDIGAHRAAFVAASDPNDDDEDGLSYGSGEPDSLRAR